MPNKVALCCVFLAQASIDLTGASPAFDGTTIVPPAARRRLRASVFFFLSPEGLAAESRRRPDADDRRMAPCRLLRVLRTGAAGRCRCSVRV